MPPAFGQIRGLIIKAYPPRHPRAMKLKSPTLRQGFLIYGSPSGLVTRTFSFTVTLETKPKPKTPQRRKYRNPIHLAKEYKRLIDSGEARNESDLARQIGTSRVTVNHFVTLLKLTPEVIKAVEALGDPMPKRYITERHLRSIVKLPSKRQRAIIEELTP